MSHPADLGRLGILILQHHEEDRLEQLRAVPQAVRCSEFDPDEGYVFEDGTRGNLPGGIVWRPDGGSRQGGSSGSGTGNDTISRADLGAQGTGAATGATGTGARPMALWSFATPSLVFTSDPDAEKDGATGTGGRAGTISRDDAERGEDGAAGGGGRSAGNVVPIAGHDATEAVEGPTEDGEPRIDVRLEPINPQYPKWASPLVEGVSGLLVGALDPDRQSEQWHPDFIGILAGSEEDDGLSTRVFDISAGVVTDDSWAGIHTLIKAFPEMPDVPSPIRSIHVDAYPRQAAIAGGGLFLDRTGNAAPQDPEDVDTLGEEPPPPGLHADRVDQRDRYGGRTATETRGATGQEFSEETDETNEDGEPAAEEACLGFLSSVVTAGHPTADKHTYGGARDSGDISHRVNAGHLRADVNIYYNHLMDGPLDLSPGLLPKEDGAGNFKTRVIFGWDNDKEPAIRPVPGLAGNPPGNPPGVWGAIVKTPLYEDPPRRPPPERERERPPGGGGPTPDPDDDEEEEETPRERRIRKKRERDEEKKRKKIERQRRERKRRKRKHGGGITLEEEENSGFRKRKPGEKPGGITLEDEENSGFKKRPERTGPDGRGGVIFDPDKEGAVSGFTKKKKKIDLEGNEIPEKGDLRGAFFYDDYDPTFPRAVASGLVTELHAPGFVGRAHSTEAPLRIDPRNNNRLSPAAREKALCRPPVIRFEFFGTEDTPGEGGDCGGAFRYTRNEDFRRYEASESSPGGVFFMPPEVGLEHYEVDFAPADIETSETYVGCLRERVYFACGYADPELGMVVEGFRWTTDASERLAFEYVDAAGSATTTMLILDTGEVRAGADPTADLGLVTRQYLEKNVEQVLDASAGSTVANTTSETVSYSFSVPSAKQKAHGQIPFSGVISTGITSGDLTARVKFNGTTIHSLTFNSGGNPQAAFEGFIVPLAVGASVQWSAVVTFFTGDGIANTKMVSKQAGLDTTTATTFEITLQPTISSADTSAVDSASVGAKLKT